MRPLSAVFASIVILTDSSEVKAAALVQTGVSLSLPYPTLLNLQLRPESSPFFAEVRGAWLPWSFGVHQGSHHFDLRGGVEWNNHFRLGVGTRTFGARFDLTGFESEGEAFLDSAAIGGFSVHVFGIAFQEWRWGAQEEWGLRLGAGVCWPLWGKARLSSRSLEQVDSPLEANVLDRVVKLPLPEILLLEFQRRWTLP